MALTVSSKDNCQLSHFITFFFFYQAASNFTVNLKNNGSVLTHDIRFSDSDIDLVFLVTAAVVT